MCTYVSGQTARRSSWRFFGIRTTDTLMPSMEEWGGWERRLSFKWKSTGCTTFWHALHMFCETLCITVSQELLSDTNIHRSALFFQKISVGKMTQLKSFKENMSITICQVTADFQRGFEWPAVEWYILGVRLILRMWSISSLQPGHSYIIWTGCPGRSGRRNRRRMQHRFLQ